MRAGFPPDWVLDLDMLSFESLVQSVEADTLEARYERFVDTCLAHNGKSKDVKDHAKEMQRSLRRARRAGADDLRSALGQ